MKTRYFISAALLALTTVGCSDLDVDIKLSTLNILILRLH